MAEEPVEIKGEMTLLSVLRLASVDLALIQDGVKSKQNSLPQLFDNSPLLVDCGQLGETCAELDFAALRRLLVELGFIPVGIRNIAEECRDLAMQAGWAVLRSGRATGAPSRGERPVEVVTEEVLTEDTPCHPLTSVKVVNRPLRSGQQVYFPEGNLVILQHTSAGSEILAGGSVHVYGSLRGRVLAGIGGDTSARIFARSWKPNWCRLPGITACWMTLRPI